MELSGIEVAGAAATFVTRAELGDDGAAAALAAASSVASAAAVASAASFALDRASLAHLIADAPACGEGGIRAAIERADYDDAAIRALARAKLGLELPPDLVADVLVGVERMDVFFALARHAGGEALPALLSLLEDRRLADDTAGIHQACRRGPSGLAK